jgi:hypothetical protein
MLIRSKRRKLLTIDPSSLKEQLGNKFILNVVDLIKSDDEKAFGNLCKEFESANMDLYLDLNKSKADYWIDRADYYLARRISDGKNILHIAAEYGVRWLLVFAFSQSYSLRLELAKSVDNYGLLPLDYACLAGHRVIANDIASLEKISWDTPLLHPLLPIILYSCIAGTGKGLKLLLNSSIESNAVDSKGRNAFYYLCLLKTYAAAGKVLYSLNTSTLN